MSDYLYNASYTWSEDSTRLIVTPSRSAKSSYFYVEECGQFLTKHPYFTERQSLNSFLIVYTLSGKGLLRYGGAEYILTANKCFFINCMNYQYYETLPDQQWEILWVHFNGATSMGYYEQFAKSGSPVIEFEEGSIIIQLLKNIIESQQNRELHCELLCSKYLVEILTELLLNNIKNRNEGLLIPEFIIQVIREIETRFSDRLSLDDLSKHCGVSKFYLSKEFKRQTDLTVNEYIINTRITYAKELLKYSGLSVADVAYQVGIGNVSHFINLFKVREGVTPLAFRKAWGG